MLADYFRLKKEHMKLWAENHCRFNICFLPFSICSVVVDKSMASIFSKSTASVAGGLILDHFEVWMMFLPSFLNCTSLSSKAQVFIKLFYVSLCCLKLYRPPVF